MAAISPAPAGSKHRISAAEEALGCGHMQSREVPCSSRIPQTGSQRSRAGPTPIPSTAVSPHACAPVHTQPGLRHHPVYDTGGKGGRLHPVQWQDRQEPGKDPAFPQDAANAWQPDPKPLLPGALQVTHRDKDDAPPSPASTGCFWTDREPARPW